MLDAATKERFENALAADTLKDLAAQMTAEGLSQAAIYHSFDLFRKFLEDAHRDADEAVLESSLENIIGYCGLAYKWFDHYLTNEEIDEYRKTLE